MFWRKDLNSMQKRMIAIMNHNTPDICHDVTFLVGKEKVEISCHKIFLYIASPVFETMFSQRHNSQGKSTRVAKRCKPIIISDVDPAGLKNVIKYAYAGTLDVEINDLVATMYAAHKYDLPELTQHCSEELKAHLSIENAVIVNQVAYLLNDANLENNSWKLIEENAADLLDLDQFLQFSHENLLKFLSLDSMPGLKSEVNIFKALIRWGNLHCIQEDMDSEQEGNLISVLMPYLSLIRFPVMELKEFNEVVVKSGVLSWIEYVKLYKYLHACSEKRVSIGESLKYPCKNRCNAQLKFVLSCAAINYKFETIPNEDGCRYEDEFIITGNSTSVKLKSVGIVLPSKLAQQSCHQCVSVGLYECSVRNWMWVIAKGTVSKSLEICYIEFDPPPNLKMNVKYSLVANICHEIGRYTDRPVYPMKYTKESLTQTRFSWSSDDEQQLQLRFIPKTCTIWALQFVN